MGMCSGANCGDSARSNWITTPIRKKDTKRAELLKTRKAFEEVKRRLQEEAKRLDEERKMQEALSQKHKDALEIDERRESQSVVVEQELHIWVVGGKGIDGIGANEGLDTKSEKLGMLMSGARIEE